MKYVNFACVSLYSLECCGEKQELPSRLHAGSALSAHGHRVPGGTMDHPYSGVEVFDICHRGMRCREH